MPTYEMNSFNPAFAGGIDYEGRGVLFNYNEPSFLANIAAQHPGNIPTDVTIDISFDRVCVLVCFNGNWEVVGDNAFLLITRRAGLDMLNWAFREGYDMSGKELASCVQGSFMELVFNPHSSGGIVLDDLSREERQILYTLYELSSCVTA